MKSRRDDGMIVKEDYVSPVARKGRRKGGREGGG